MSIPGNETPNGPPGSIEEMTPTLAAVRHNCNISDARHAADYTLCIYLLKMREFYRWENDIAFSTALSHKDLTGWLTAREELWETIAENPYEPVPVADREYDPFDAASINHHLSRMGYVYSSGIGRNMKPHFFVAALDEQRQYHDTTLYISGKEYVRDLTAPPAMSLGDTIFIRRESVRRMLWEKIEEWRWNKPANAMQKAINSYDFDALPDQALEQMTEKELRSVLLHEIGETMAGTELGSGWEELLASIPHSKAELMMRAVRDHLADALSTLPGLLGDMHPASLHFYIANLTNMRKSLFPGLLTAYDEWVRTGNADKLMIISGAGRRHWLSLAQGILDVHQNHKGDCQHEIIALVESSTL